MARPVLSPGSVPAPTQDELRGVLETARGIAKEAAAFLAGVFRRGGAVREKGRSDLVTEHDERCERLLRDRLASAFPSHGIVGEEGEAEREGRELVWYLDPIDGTSNFAHGHPFFCLAMGLTDRSAERGDDFGEPGPRPIAGIVVAPALGIEWSAARGLGAYRNGERIEVSRTERLDQALCGTGFPANRATSSDNNYARFLGIDAASHGVRRCGAAAMELCFVADGAYDAFWDLGLKPWDVCAGTVLVEEAGGRITDFAGGPARLDGGRILGSNGRLHPELVRALGEGLRLPPLTLPGASGLRTGDGVG